MGNPLTMFSPKVRKTLYVTFLVLALVVGGIDVWFYEANPDWLERLKNVLQYLTIPFTALAASNTPASPVEIEEAAEEIVADEEPLDPPRPY